MKKVLVVDTSDHVTVEMVTCAVNDICRTESGGGPVASVQTVGSITSAMELADEGKVDVMIFTSSAMIMEAETVSSDHPHIRVILLVDKVPSDKIVILPKKVNTPSLIKSLVLLE